MITPNDYKNAYGTWIVTTEGDCEGRSTKLLGVYTGYIDEIAFALAEKCCYALTFERASTEIPTPKSEKEEVNVTLDIKSGTWRMSPDERVEFFKDVFKGRNVYIDRGTAYASVTLRKNEKDALKAKRMNALSKLTDEEKILLGISKID